MLSPRYRYIRVFVYGYVELFALVGFHDINEISIFF
jgi:hypothetical protein